MDLAQLETAYPDLQRVGSALVHHVNGRNVVYGYISVGGIRLTEEGEAAMADHVPPDPIADAVTQAVAENAAADAAPPEVVAEPVAEPAVNADDAAALRAALDG